MSEIKKATFGGGCFWCTEAVYQRLKGVQKVIPGYAGGHTENPTYREICSKTTGHAEVIQVEYDADIISYADLLEVFWSSHDPTTLNRQGNDSGPQYRSIILYHDDEQMQLAEKSKLQVATPLYEYPIVTEIMPLENFYVAENYHHDYYNRNSYQPYCSVVINPKLTKLRKNFADRLKTSDVHE